VSFKRFSTCNFGEPVRYFAAATGKNVHSYWIFVVEK